MREFCKLTFSCHPTEERTRLANWVLAIVAIVGLSCFGAMHQSSLRRIARQAHQQDHEEAACASAPPEVERTSHQN